MTELHIGVGQCDTHGQECKIVRPEGFIVGTSCKDISYANNKSEAVVSSEPGGTIRGLEHFLQCYPPDWVVSEQNDAFDKKK